MKSVAVVLLLVIGASLLGVLPFERHDVSELQPAQTLVVEYLQEDQVRLSSDGGLTATGPDWTAAVEQLRRNAQGYLFLNTAERVIFVGRAVTLLPQVAADEVLRPAAQVYAVDQAISPDGATAYLKTRDGKLTLGQIRTKILEGETFTLPQIYSTKEGIYTRT